LFFAVWAPLTAAGVAVCGALLGNNLSGMLAAKFGARPTLLHTTWLIVTIQASVLFLTFHFVDYWFHRAMHKVPLLWSFHRSHHSAETPNFFASARANPIELIEALAQPAVCNAVFGGILFYATGTPLNPLTLKVLGVIGTIDGFGWAIAHSHIPLSLGKLNYVFGSSVMHQIHHSREIQHRDKNFGMGFQLFDWMFGSLYMPKPGETYVRWGLSEEEVGERNPHKSLRDLYLEPLGRMWRIATGRRPDLEGSANSFLS
jgi:sterol desaturase/sphingolipid hydroxylase (fatty acid hydroxylase superfamily)